MSDPQRLIDAGADDFERSVLTSARADEGSSRALQRAMLAFGGAGATAALPALARTSSRTLAAKWVAAGVTVIGVASVVIVPAIRSQPPARAPASVMASANAAPPAVTLAPPRPISPVVQTPKLEAPSKAQTPRISAHAPSEPRATRLSQPQPRTSSPVPTRSTEERSDTPPPSIASGPTSLAREVALLDSARAELKLGNGMEALNILDAYARESARASAQPVLGQEASLLRIEALLRLDRRSDAEALGNEILARQPNGPHASRVRALLGASSL